jgi:serine O-acetyltransferase
MSFSELVFSDYLAHRPGRKASWLAVLLRLPSNPGLLASILIRAHQCLGRSGRGFLAMQLRTLGNVLLGMDLAPGAVIGPGLMLLHPEGITFGFGARIGANVQMAGGVVLAARYYEHKEGREQEYAVIEDGAGLGAHAVVVGGVRIGRNAVVGANSVVLSDVPEGAVVMGIPARRVGTREGSPA